MSSKATSYTIHVTPVDDGPSECYAIIDHHVLGPYTIGFEDIGLDKNLELLRVYTLVPRVQILPWRYEISSEDVFYSYFEAIAELRKRARLEAKNGKDSA